MARLTPLLALLLASTLLATASAEDAEINWSKDAAPEAAPDADAPAEGEPAEPGADERATWIATRIQEIVQGTEQERDAAIRALIKNDEEGDCTAPLLALLDEHKKNTGLIVALIRGMGVDGFRVGAPPIAEHLSHKQDAVRGNAAVSLEYIGSNEKAVLSALKKAAGKEMIAKLENVQAFWVGGLRRFWEQVALCCEGQGSIDAIAAGVRGFVAFARGGDLGRYGAETRSLMDEYRVGRDNSEFKPLGDGILGDPDEG